MNNDVLNFVYQATGLATDSGYIFVNALTLFFEVVNSRTRTQFMALGCKHKNTCTQFRLRSKLEELKRKTIVFHEIKDVLRGT